MWRLRGSFLRLGVARTSASGFLAVRWAGADPAQCCADVGLHEGCGCVAESVPARTGGRTVACGRPLSLGVGSAAFFIFYFFIFVVL